MSNLKDNREFNFATRFVKLGQSLPYIIAPALFLSILMQKFINLDKLDKDALFWSQVCFSSNLCYYVYRQPNTPQHRPSVEAQDEKTN
ncbi:uncharacterized protein EAE97_000101 [Botrytis byssoidea]|uniref:Uncharacterized protein n=1 Tax=Botrytis byssoidea TaxID=139641 RepID=A0A9P5IUQ9_9HELO|nr:uncharacterized protein EAE97_000101 [Botrytis byssoidea]KAF7954842.1 hypothetical protein EAE97_000101 [Botrytis byssoidea]